MTNTDQWLEPTWRWFGPKDQIPLSWVRQAAATGIVTSLHHIPPGTAWTDEDVSARKAEIQAAGLTWSVVESIPVTDDIKRRGPNWDAEVDAWLQSLRAVGRAGVPVVCYNFMPVLDWTRTDLAWTYGNGAAALRFDAVDLAAWDIHVLGRSGARVDYSDEITEAAARRHAQTAPKAMAKVQAAILQGLPGADRGFSIDEFRGHLGFYAGLSADDLRSNLLEFQSIIAPEAEALGVHLAIHPDDPPWPLFGLPRVVSQRSDFDAMVDATPSPANGITLCTGSLGARADNDLPALAEAFADRVHFIHLRNVRREPDGSFHEAEHLNGSTDMAAVARVLLAEGQGRVAQGGRPIPFRPDHGHIIGPDAAMESVPGYTYAGRLRGMGELRGLFQGLVSSGK
ncbi:MAG: mannonate dehydratase [Pseudomonadota bacterium]